MLSWIRCYRVGVYDGGRGVLVRTRRLVSNRARRLVAINLCCGLICTPSSYDTKRAAK